MKKLIGLLVLFSVNVFATPYEIYVQQMNSTNTGYSPKILPVPSTNSLLIFDPITNLPTWVDVSTNFTYTGGVLATGGVARSFNDSPGRSLVSTTSSTGYQVSSTRDSHVCYEGSISTTSTIGGAAAASVFLETASTNSTTPGDWTTKASQTYSNTITLAIALNQVQANNWSICRIIPAGLYVRIRSGSITGTASVSINSTQQEVLL